MTWAALIKALLTDPLAWMFALIVGMFSALGGYFYGQHAEHVLNENAKKSAIIEQYENVRPKEAIVATTANEASKDHEKVKSSNKINAAAVAGSFGGLRVRASCNNDSPSTAASSGKSGTGAGSERTGTSETDFDDVAQKIIELGNDYDNAINQIKNLNVVLDAYRKACGG